MKKKIIQIILFLLSFSLFCEETETPDSTSFFNDDLLEIENYISTQFNEDQLFVSLNLLEFGLAIRKIPLVISGKALELSWLTGKHKPKYPLNNYIYLLGLPAAIAAGSGKVSEGVTTILSYPCIATLVVNALTNPQIQLKLDRNSHFRLFTGVTTDVFYINEKFKTRCNLNYGIAINFDWKFRLYLSQNMSSITKKSEKYFIGITFGFQGDFDAWNAWMSI